MQIIIDTAVDTLADINLATYVLEVLKARHGQTDEKMNEHSSRRDEKQADWLSDVLKVPDPTCTYAEALIADGSAPTVESKLLINGPVFREVVRTAVDEVMVKIASMTPESRHEIFPLTKEQLGPHVTFNELIQTDVADHRTKVLRDPVPDETEPTVFCAPPSDSVSPQPIVDARDNPFRGRSDSTPNPSVPNPVPAPPASDVAQLPAYLRNRLPDVPSLAVDEDTDAAGVKWDATLHSESRSKTADGTWRKRRTAKNVVSAVSVESQPESPTPELNRAVPEVPTPPTPETALAESFAALAATVVPPPPQAPFVPVTTFRELMEQMTINMASRAVTSKDINAICHEHGIESLQMCFDNTALIPSVHTAIHKVAMKAGA